MGEALVGQGFGGPTDVRRPAGIDAVPLGVLAGEGKQEHHGGRSGQRQVGPAAGLLAEDVPPSSVSTGWVPSRSRHTAAHLLPMRLPGGGVLPQPQVGGHHQVQGALLADRGPSERRFPAAR